MSGYATPVKIPHVAPLYSSGKPAQKTPAAPAAPAAPSLSSLRSRHASLTTLSSSLSDALISSLASDSGRSLLSLGSNLGDVSALGEGVRGALRPICEGCDEYLAVVDAELEQIRAERAELAAAARGAETAAECAEALDDVYAAEGWIGEGEVEDVGEESGRLERGAYAVVHLVERVRLSGEETKKKRNGNGNGRAVASECGTTAFFYGPVGENSKSGSEMCRETH